MRLTQYCSIIIAIFLHITSITYGQDFPSSLPHIPYHLTANPWEPYNTPKEAYLDAIEGIARTASQFQNEEGAIIDPYLKREHQYSTPYYAFAVGVLIKANREKDLLASGILAMNKALTDFSKGNASIPDQHGEFYIAPLSEAIELYRPYIDSAQYQRWQNMITTPLEKIWRGAEGRLNNWRTYAMKGEWLRAKYGFIKKQEGLDFIEDTWKNTTQYERIALDKWNLYQDWSSDPQSHAVEAVGRGNLTSLALGGYDGPSANQILDIIRRGGQTSMLLLSPSGQCPPNGRTDDHVFNDILYQLIFEALAEDALALDNTSLAGQYRRSAMLAFNSIQRWRRADNSWKGSFYITKNKYDPGDRVGYQPASQWGNYSGAMMYHLAEAYLTRQSAIKEVPAPTEIGGYAFQTDARFSTFIANAGGMQVFVNLRGDAVPKYGVFWTPLGAVRFSKVNWDDRLGPPDGAKNHALASHHSGLSFGPTWLEKGNWVRLADMAEHYQGIVKIEFVHPLLVKFSITYTYVTGRGGPYFRQEFVVTPDGVMTISSGFQNTPFGVSAPLLVDDGTPLQTDFAHGIASTKYPSGGDSQHFIGLNKDLKVEPEEGTIRSTYGDLLPVKFQSTEKQQYIFIYPKAENDPKALEVKNSFSIVEDGFSSTLGKVKGNLYIGRYTAGGYGESLDLNNDGHSELIFNQSCGFVAQLRDGKIVAIETDIAIEGTLYGEKISLETFEPFYID